MTDQFITILEKENEQEWISFLRSLTNDQKKKLTPQIKKLTKEYGEYEPLRNGRYGHIKGTDAQRNMLQVASFVCFNRADYEKSPFALWMLEKEKLSKIIDWYTPDWFSDFVNKEAALDYVPYYLNYDWIMELTEKGCLQPGKDLLAKLMTQSIFEQSKERNWVFCPENLLKRPITLREHIWYLFDVETNLYYSDRFLYFGNEITKDKIGWKSTFIQYSAEGKIDRSRLLKETLVASNKNFNKVLSGWFTQLFTDLQPTTKEILLLQKELITVLNSPHSKPVNTALQMIKKIVTEDEWHIHEFLDVVPVLLASDTKATVASTMMILEKIIKTHKKYRNQIAQMVCQVFIHPDEELQTRAAKLIVENRQNLNESIRKELLPYSNNILASAKKLFENFIQINVQQQKPVVSEKQNPKVGELIKIPAVKDKDDFIFLASQVFDNNEPWHIDQFAAACVKFRSLLRTDEFNFLEPAFQRALNLTKTGVQFNMGFLEHLSAMFCIDFGNHLISNFPVATESIKSLYKKYDKKEGEQNTSWTVSPANSSYTERWKTYGGVIAFQPYKQLLLLALRKIKQGDSTPLLSTPTHAPCWVDPQILIDRLLLYLENNVVPDEMDLQIAISRCLLKNDAKAHQYASERLHGEFRNLFMFLLEEKAEPRGPFTYKAAWMVASLAKKQKKTYSAFESFSYYRWSFKKYTGQLDWQSVDEEYTYDRYDYQLQKNVPVKDRRKIFRVLEDHTEKKTTAIKKIFSGLFSHEKDDAPILYDFLSIKTKYLSVEDRDIKRLLFLAPNNPEPFLANILNQCMQYPKFWSETDKKLVTSVLQALHETWNDFGEMAHVFVGTCMITSDKTVANIAGEIWINAVTTGKINNELLGQVIGRHESIEFAPLKRFTDLVNENLMRISDEHNKALQIIIENILAQLPQEPIKNLKKLLEIYSELIAINDSSIHGPNIISKLQYWNKSEGLQKILGRMLDARV